MFPNPRIDKRIHDAAAKQPRLFYLPHLCISYKNEEQNLDCETGRDKV